jgi:hypothetical protein
MEYIKTNNAYELKTREAKRQILIGTILMVIGGITLVVSIMNIVIYFLNTDLVSQYH